MEDDHGGLAFSLQDYVTGKRKSGVEFEDSECIIIRDAYPKVRLPSCMMTSQFDGGFPALSGEAPLPTHSKVGPIHAQHPQ